jgi:hypothetical protein
MFTFSGELNDLYSSTNIIRMIKPRRMKRTGNVALMGKRRRAYSILVGIPEGRRPPGIPRHRWEGNIKMGLQESGTGFIWLMIRTGGWLL